LLVARPQRQLELVGRDAAPVVRDGEAMVERALDPHLDRTCVGIERVLEHFLERREWAVDHLTRGDARGGVGREAMDSAGRKSTHGEAGQLGRAPELEQGRCGSLRDVCAG
jgi:hypothetical protein